MQYSSTNNQSIQANFREATISGQAPDKGLYFPFEIPKLSKKFIEAIEHLSKEEIAFEVMRPYVDNCIPENELKNIVSETINFNFPLTRVTKDVFSLELFHGPTLAFKDVGARFMSRCLKYFIENEKKKITVLVATSGDTGSAVANGFYNVEGIHVVILYPSKKVSTIQEAQLTSLGNNITAIEIDGSFDDCQRMVKAAFADEALNQKMFLTSANSINVARWLPQQFYYFFAYQQWKEKKHAPVISVPSGNFGNICAGLLAYFSGLPVQHFVAACNSNDTVPKFLETENYTPQPSVATISNAMDVGNPSNFVRILELFQHNIQSLKKMFTAYSINDEQTKFIIKKIWQEKNYLMDTHGAVGFLALQRYLQSHPQQQGYFLETAHPVKFYDVIEPVINQKIEIPASIQSLLHQKKQSIQMKANGEELKSFLMEVK